MNATTTSAPGEPRRAVTALPGIDRAPSLARLADATPLLRNRAVDAYRAAAMMAVALGHWLAADVRMAHGRIIGSNALDRMPDLHVLTWIFQVMPIFFCIGGFSNAMSLDSHHRAGRSSAAWVRARLLRLTTPSVYLAGFWLIVLAIAPLFGFAALAATAASVAAIPLWFLGNYVADTTLAPITLRWYRRSGRRFVRALCIVFACGEAARFTEHRALGAVNIIVGWLLFQVLGFAWKDGHLPGRRRLVALAAASLAAAAALVATGPWPLALVGVPGARFANTWPPSVVLLAYGFGICGLAIAAAPTLDRFLAGRRRAWTLVIAANANVMTSYLWHFTALAVASFGLAAVGLLPTAAAGTGAWWVQKLPVLGAALVVLLGLLALLGRRERAATSPGTVSGTRAAVSGAVLAVGFETWTIAQGRTALAAIGMATVIGVHTALHRPRR